MADDKKPDESFLKKINTFFSRYSFKVDDSNKKKSPKIVPLKRDFDSKSQRQKFIVDKPEQFPSYVDQLYSQWKASSASQYDFADRKKMYQEMDMMYNNNPLIARAIDLTAHEVVQADSNNRIIGVEAEKKQRDHIEKFFDKIQIDSYIFSTAKNIIKYGDAFWILSFYDKGVGEILQSDPYDVEDRIEFTPNEVEKELRGMGINSLFKNITNDKKMMMLAQNIMEQEDYSSFFRAYLFGFQIGSFVLPPWRCLHFRNYDTNSFFSPFGTPTYIHALAPVKMYDMALGLQILARQVRFPIDVYKLTIPTAAMPTDKLELATEFIREWQNSGLKQTRKENQGMGEVHVTIDGLFNYEQISPQLDLGRIDDLELLRDDIILATGLPRNFLDANNGSFGNSGISLTQQFKPYARMIYRYQAIILEQITQLVRIDMIQSGNFELEEIDFKLSMPYPEAQNNPEIISSQESLFNLANSILDGIKDRLGGGETEIFLPADLIRDVYKKVAPYDPATIDTWIDKFVAERERVEKAAKEAEGGGEGGGEEADFTFESLRRKLPKNQIKQIIEQEVHKGKQGYSSEYQMAGRHWYSSRKKNLDFSIDLFEKINTKSKISKLKLMNEELEIEENKFNQFKNQIKKENNRKKLKELGLTEEDDNSTDE
jgi:hypothetical protein